MGSRSVYKIVKSTLTIQTYYTGPSSNRVKVTRWPNPSPINEIMEILYTTTKAY